MTDKNRKKWNKPFKQKTLHRMIAGFTALLMVVSIMPAIRPAAATNSSKVRLGYLGQKGGQVMTSYVNVVDALNNNELLYRDSTISGINYDDSVRPGKFLFWLSQDERSVLPSGKANSETGGYRVCYTKDQVVKARIDALTKLKNTTTSGNHAQWNMAYYLRYAKMKYKDPDGKLIETDKWNIPEVVSVTQDYYGGSPETGVRVRIRYNLDYSNVCSKGQYTTDFGFAVPGSWGSNIKRVVDHKNKKAYWEADIDIWAGTDSNGGADKWPSQWRFPITRTPALKSDNDASIVVTPNWTGATYSYRINYNSKYPNGSNVSKGFNYLNDNLSNAVVKTPADLGYTYSHYQFTGWKETVENKNYQPGNSILMTGNLNMEAQWKQVEFNVKYDKNGATAGSAPLDQQYYKVGSQFTAAGGSALKKPGKLFDGWNTSPQGNGTNYAAGSKIAMKDGGMTLYAKWKDAPKYILNYNANGGTGSMASENYFNDGISGSTSVTVKNNAFTKNGLHFKNWLMDDAAGTIYNPGNRFTINRNSTLKAQWGAKLTYNANAADAVGSVPVDNNVYGEGDRARVKANDGGAPLKRPKHQFAGWNNTAGSDQETSDYSPTGQDELTLTTDKTLYAHWKPSPEYNVKYMLNAPEDVSEEEIENAEREVPKDNQTYYDDGLSDKIRIAQAPADMSFTGYRFDGWSDTKGGNTKFRAGDVYQVGARTPKETILYAKWVPAKKYHISYDVNKPAGTSADDVKGTVPIDSKEYFNDRIHDKMPIANPADTGLQIKGNTFLNWNTKPDGTGDSYAPGSAPIPVTKYGKDVKLYAQWLTHLTITGVNDPDKTYDGTAAWNGTLQFNGARPGDRIRITGTSAQYQDENGNPEKNAGVGKTLSISGLQITGQGAGHYMIKESMGTGGFYNKNNNTYTTRGTIRKRDITIKPTASPSVITQGNTIPNNIFSLAVAGGSLGSGDSLSTDFGTPEYSCIYTKPDGSKVELEQGSEANGPRDYYELSVNGLANDNYQITLDTSKVKVVLPASVQAAVTYDANGGTGAVPADSSSPYYISANSSVPTTVNVLPNVNVTRSGYQFLGWDRNKNCTGMPEFPDNGRAHTFQLTGDTTLYAIWKGSTPLTINGLGTKSKVYDGTTAYTGSVMVTPAVPGDDVSIHFTQGNYDTKDVGTGKTITLQGITLAGADAGKYVLVNGGMYDADANTITVHSGEITKRNITVKPVLPSPDHKNTDPLPGFGIALGAGTTLGQNDSLNRDFGTPVFHCINAEGIEYETGCEPDNYKVTVSGLSNDNYNITYEDESLEVADGSGKKKVTLSYDGNGAEGGSIPEDEDYYIFTNSNDNEWVHIPSDVPELRGCRFAGWSTNQNAAAGGSDPIYAPGSTRAFQIRGNTTLYAVWEADTPLEIVDLTKKSMVYNNTDRWNGDIKVQGIADGDDVELTYGKGTFSQKDIGDNLTIRAEGLRLTGDDAFRYYLTDGGKGIYRQASQEAIVTDGEITKRPVTIEADVPGGIQKAQKDNPAPLFQYRQAATGETFAQGESIDIIDDTNVVYTIKDRTGNIWNWNDIETAGTYFVEVGGLKADNYEIRYKHGRLSVADKYGTKPVYITYHANGADGTVPVDDPEEDYLLCEDPDIEKPTTVVMEPGNLEKKGYKFKEWNTHANGSGTSFQPGDQIVLAGDVNLYAIFEGNTPLYITGLTNLKKIYDGSEKWQGNVLVEGADPEDQITVTYTDGLYSDKDAGDGKVVKALGVTITGNNLDKYIIKNSQTASYDPDDRIVTVDYGVIDPRELEIIPIGAPGTLDWSTGVPTYRMNYGDELPGYQLFLPASAQIINPDVMRDFGTPAYDCRSTSGEALEKGSSPGYYKLTVSGLRHKNYDIQQGNSYIEVYAPGMREAKVTYFANGGIGAIPIDHNRYAIFDDVTLNSTVRVQNHTMTKQGYRFKGWNTQADGKGITYQPGENFRIMGDTSLYAVWEQDEIITPDDPDNTKDPGEDSKPSGTDDPDDNKTKDPDQEIDGQVKPADHKTAENKTADKKITDKKTSAAASDKEKQKKEKSGAFRLKSVSSDEKQLTSLYDEQVPKGAAPFQAQQKQQSWIDRMFGNGLGPISECLLHWLFVLLTLVTLLYDVLRKQYIKKKERTESSRFFDQLLPLAAEPLGLILFLFRRCALDLWFALACFLITALGSYFLNRYYSDSEMDKMYPENNE